MCFPTSAVCDRIYITRIKTPTCFAIQVASSGSYYNKDVLATLLIYILFIVINLIKINENISFLFNFYQLMHFYVIKILYSYSCNIVRSYVFQSQRIIIREPNFRVKLLIKL